MVLPKSKFNNVGESLFWTDWDQVFVGMVDDPAQYYFLALDRVLTFKNYKVVVIRNNLCIQQS